MSKISKIKKASIFALCMMLTVAFMPINSFAYAADTEAEIDYAQMETMQVNENGEVDESADVTAIKDSVSDETVYNPLYFMEYGNSDYISMDDIRMSDFAEPVTVARGVASYNYEKQKEFEFGKNSIAAMNYEIPVYDLDENSDYYVAFPNTNLNSDKIGSYDFVLTYNNDFGEVINDVIYENNIAYIKKDVVDNPKNEMALQPGGVIAMQVNYYFKSIEEEKPFSKKIPVQVLEGDTPDYKTIEVENMFAEDTISFPLGDYDASKIHVMMNGSILPINEEAYSINDGILTIRSSAAVVSSINITVEETTVAETAMNLFTDKASAVTPANMKYYKATNGKEVVLSGVSDIYVGWRGHYNGTVPIKFSHVHTNLANDDEWEVSLSKLVNLPEWRNSLNYMYGAKSSGEATHDPALIGYWALNSYTKGKHADTGVTINRDTKYDNTLDSTNQKKTMYEWMKEWAGKLEKNNERTSVKNGIMESNGLGGFNNFAIPWPKSKITGNARNLISDPNADGYGKGNVSINFDNATESGKTALGAGDYMVGSCAHIKDSATNNGDYADASAKYTVYVSCLAKADDYVVLCFACASPNKQEGMGVYKFRTGTPVKVKKTSARGEITDSNGCYDFNGSTFKFYESEADAKANKDVVATFKTNAKGETEEQMMAPGTYYIVETSPGKGYSVPDAYKASNGGKKVTVSGTDTITFTVANVPQVGNLVLKKTDDVMEKQQGNAELINAQFLVKYYDGQYSTKEAAEASGKATRTWHMRTTDLGGDYGIDFSSPKHTAEYSSGNEDTFYSYPDKNYVAPIGTYVFEEIAGPKGYKTINDVKVMNVTENSNNAPIIATVDSKYPNVVKRGGVQLQKKDNDTDRKKPQGDATLEGAEFTIVNMSDHPVMVRDVEYLSSTSPTVDWDNARKQSSVPGIKKVEPGKTVGVLRTNAEGYTKSLTNDLPYGKYRITETKAPVGYNIDTKFELNITIDDSREGKLTPDNPETYTVQDPVKRGDVYIEKWDKELNKSEAIGGKGHDASKHKGTDLNGIQFTIVNKSKETIVVPKVIDPKAEGYKGDAYWGDEKTGMWMIEDGQTKALEAGTAKEVAPNGVVGIITTHWNAEKKAYEAHTSGLSLPYGTYEITETKTNKFYELTDKAKRIVEIRNHREVVNKTNDAKPLVWKDYVYRQNVAFEKKKVNLDKLDERAQYIPFKITNKTTGEYSYAVVDQNGQYNSWTHPHSRNTNGYDKYIDSVVKQGGVVDSNKLKEIMLGDEIDKVAPGTWFGLGEDGSIADANDEFAAFPYGTYTVEELKCTNNKGYKLVKPFTFEVKQPNKGVANKNVEPRSVTGIEFEVTNVQKVPVIGTTAKDNKTGINLGIVGNEVTIVDTVKYEDLNEGQEYKLVGVLMDRSTGKSLKVDGKEVTSTKTFTPKEEDGEINVEFKLNTENLKGKDIVVFEKLFTKEEGKEVQKAEHEKIDAMGQTIHIPELGTQAKDAKTNINIGAAAEKTEIIDTVKYTNLVEGKEYTLKGTLMNKKTGKPVKENGKDVTSEVKFTPSDVNGTVEMKFTVNTSTLKGQPIVVFEKLEYKGIEVVTHSDINDLEQTVFIPKIGTSAQDAQTEDNVGVVGKTSIVDTVKYEGLKPEVKYTIKGKLMDKETGKPLLVNDKEVTAEKEFFPDESDGEVKLTFELNSSDIRGKSVVVFEKAYYKNIQIAAHENINDEGQTVNFPDAKTSAKDSQTKHKSGVVGSKVEIIDTVTYQNLTPGKEYTVKGKLMDKESNEPIKENGKEVTSETTFKPTEKDGSVEMKFELNSETLRGKSVVVFEDVVYKNITVVSHADIEDEEQTIDYPDAKTQAKDSKTNDSVGTIGEKEVVIDTVSYTNLIPGNEYTVKGKLMDKETGEPILEDGKEITSETKFTPTEKNGTVEMKFNVNSTLLQNKSIVVFEDVYFGEVKVVSHADINDEAQTINYNNLKTNATVNGKHEVKSTKVVTITDKVTYENLTIGKKYTIKGILMDKNTGKPITVNGSKITAEKTFTAEKANGSVNLKFKVNAKAVQGKTTVVFEDLYHNDVKIGTHSDLKDKAQTVKFKKVPGTPSNPKSPSTPSGGNNAKTGDNTPWWIFGIMAALAAVAGFAVYRKRRAKIDVTNLF